MKRIFWISFWFLVFGLVSKISVFAYETECDSGDRYCSGKTRYYCSSYRWKSVSCSYGCHDGYCKCLYGGGYFYSGTQKCMSGKEKVCSSGTWTTVKTCSDGCGTNGVDCQVDGDCGSAHKTTRTSTPKSGTRCDRGSVDDFSSNGTDVMWTWKCKGSNGGSTVDCYTYKSCQRSASDYSVNTGRCIYEPGVCVNVYGGDTVGTQDCGGAYRSDCCIYNADRMECDPENQTGCVCGTCISDGPGVSHCESTRTEGEDGECATLTKGYCSYTSIPKCNTDYGYTTSDSVGSDGYFNWTCKGQSSASCRTAGSTSNVCRASKVDPAVSVCGVAATKIYSVQSIPVVEPEDAELCGEDNTYDVDCDNCDMKGTDGTLNWTCTGDCNTPINCLAANDVPPVPVIPPPIYVPDGGSNPAVTVDASGRSHICQPEFGGIKSVGWRITATDVNGVADIGTVQIRLNSSSGVGATSGLFPVNNGTANVTIDTSGVQTGTYNVEVLVNDVDGGVVSNWVDTGRDFRVWDCLVSVSGTFYDGSGQTVSCSAGSGYTNTIPAAATFSMAYYLGSGAPRTMNVSSPTFTSGDKLYWNTPVAYQPVFTDFPGADPTEMKINGSTCVSGISLDPKAYVDPYVDNPSMTVDYSSVLDQDAWFSVTNGSVISKAKISNYVPVTCNAESCQTSVGGVVWSKGRSTLSTYDQVSNQRRMNEKSLELKDVSYRYFFDNYFSKLGIGVTVGSSKNWSEIASLTGILLIKGNLLIDQNITGTEMRVIGVSGDITIDPSVKQINAVLFARNVSVGGTSSDQLQINGSIYSSGSVTLNRSFTDKSKNNITPAVKVNYDPSILFKMPKEVSKSVTQWRMN